MMHSNLLKSVSNVISVPKEDTHEHLPSPEQHILDTAKVLKGTGVYLQLMKPLKMQL